MEHIKQIRQKRECKARKFTGGTTTLRLPNELNVYARYIQNPSKSKVYYG